MAGFIPGLLPTNHSQEKEFAKAYEDVLERYKGKKMKTNKHCSGLFIYQYFYLFIIFKSYLCQTFLVQNRTNLLFPSEQYDE